MNLTDLTEVLRERAEPLGTSQDARLAGVRAKVTASRRRRAVAGAACVVLALVGVVFAVIPKSGTSSEPAVPVRNFPEYQSGTRLLAQAWGDLPGTGATVRFVPESLELKVFWKCEIGEGKVLHATITVNDRPFSGSTCGDGAVTVKPADWGLAGVVVGEPSTVTIVVEGERGSSPDGGTSTAAPPPRGTFGIAVGEGVPPDEYPFPPRPEVLPTFDRDLLGERHLVSADPEDPMKRTEVTVEWPDVRLLVARLNAPGRLRVLLNDVEVVDHSQWDYAAGGSQSIFAHQWESTHGLALAEGDHVRVTVIPERVTGDWEVVVTN